MRLSVRTLLLCGAAVALLTASGGIRRDELACEEAVSRLVECCPQVDPGQYACFYTAGCGTAPTYPEVSETESRAVLAASCETIRVDYDCTLKGAQ